MGKCSGPCYCYQPGSPGSWQCKAAGCPRFWDKEEWNPPEASTCQGQRDYKDTPVDCGSFRGGDQDDPRTWSGAEWVISLGRLARRPSGYYNTKLRRRLVDRLARPNER